VQGWRAIFQHLAQCICKVGCCRKALIWPLRQAAQDNGLKRGWQIKAELARLLTEAGKPPKVLTAVSIVGAEKAKALFEAAYDEHAHRLAELYRNL